MLSRERTRLIPGPYGNGSYQRHEALLDAKEVKRLLKCSLPWVYKAAAQGLLPCVRIPCPGKGARKPKTMLRFKREDILAFIEQYYHGSKTC